MSLISIKVIGADKTSERFKKMQAAAYAALQRSVTRGALKLVAYVKSQKLTGQVLQVQTGRLRRSITADFQAQEGKSFRALVGTNVSYARVHEYGYSGPEAVPTHTRLVKQAFGKALRFPVWATVRAHTRKVNYKERSFLRSSIVDLRPELETSLRKAVVKAMKEVK